MYGYWGKVLRVNLAIGCITPPVGLDLFVVSDITGIPIEKISKAVFPYIVVLVINLIILTYFPQIILFVPHLLGS